MNLPFHIRLLAGGEFFYEASAPVEREASTSRPTPTRCRSSARRRATRRRLLAHPALPAHLRLRHRPLRRRRIRRRAVAPVPEADARRRRSYPEGLRRSAVRPRAARLGRRRLQLPARLSHQAQLRDRLPLAGVPEHLDTGRRHRATAPTRTCKTEASQSFQGELNARLLRNVRKVRELEVRADYSYTLLSELIQIRGGQYGNTGKRAIHSVEGYAKLYLNGDHFLQASYTYLYSIDDRRRRRCARSPNHWATLRRLVQHRQEPARRQHEPAASSAPTKIRTASRRRRPAAAAAGNDFVGTTTARAERPDLRSPDAGRQSAARLPPALPARPAAVLAGSSTTCSTSTITIADIFDDLTPTIEMTPTPAPGFNFFAQPRLPLLSATSPTRAATWRSYRR